MAEVLEITWREPTLARSVVNSSVIPSTKYSCDGSPEKLSRGRTAVERIGGDAPGRGGRVGTIQTTNPSGARSSAASAKIVRARLRLGELRDSLGASRGS